MTVIDVEVRCGRAGDTMRNSIRFDDNGSMHEIRWEHSGDLVPREPRVADFALIAALPYCMNRGANVRIRGGVTASLIEAAEECVDVWSLWRPDLFKRIRLDASEVVSDRAPVGRDSVLAFSGGVDATFALIANRQGLVGHRSRDVKTGVMIHGFDIPVEQPEVFTLSREHARHILSDAGAALSTVRTNWRNYCVDWEMAHGFGIAAVLHQFHGSASHGIIAADEAYSDEELPWGNSSVTNPLLSGVSFPIHTCGGGYTRAEKIREISGYESVRSHIRVCWETLGSGLNCGICEKCVRTRLMFFVAGCDEIPAFPVHLTADAVSRIQIRSEVQRRYFLDILKHPRANLLDSNIRRALHRVTQQSGSKGFRTLIRSALRRARSAMFGTP
jgi:hypothetical protein